MPSATPGPTSTPDATLYPSKYENVFVQTIEEKGNEGRSLLHVAYPVTEHPGINERMESVAQAFIDEFHTVAARQEAAYQDYVRETGEEAASFVTHYVQHFDVTVADVNLISLAIEQYRGTGGTGSTQVTGYVFDRQAGAELPLENLLVGDKYLERLSVLSRAELERLARIQMEELDFASDAAREEWWAVQLSMIEGGTTPEPENFDGVLFLEDGTLRITFDKYQVGPGAAGVVTIELPVENVADLLDPQVRQLLELEAAAATVTALPSPSAAPSPTVTSAPAAPDGEGARESVDCSQVLCVALTFDDGPSVYTDRLLDVLRAHNVPATFFVLGQSARVQPETVARMVREGHEVGNHSWSHRNMQELADVEIREQVSRTNGLVAQVTGSSPVHFRPPYGAYDEHVVSVVSMPVVLWSLDPLDWKDRDADIVAQRIGEASAGMIILAHDIHETTVAAMPTVLESLSSRGIRLVTVTELVGPPGPLPGHVYRRGGAPQ
jgi:peptidoglycan/xylan/chitin deacetylase (PgdA/CDA1 family)